jgi:hypothetical protein
MLEAALFPKKLACNFWYFDFCTTFYLGPNPVPVSLKEKKLRFRFHNAGYESVDPVVAA